MLAPPFQLCDLRQVAQSLWGQLSHLSGEDNNGIVFIVNEK